MAKIYYRMIKTGRMTIGLCRQCLTRTNKIKGPERNYLSGLYAADPLHRVRGATWCRIVVKLLN